MSTPEQAQTGRAALEALRGEYGAWLATARYAADVMALPTEAQRRRAWQDLRDPADDTATATTTPSRRRDQHRGAYEREHATAAAAARRPGDRPDRGALPRAGDPGAGQPARRAALPGDVHPVRPGHRPPRHRRHALVRRRHPGHEAAPVTAYTIEIEVYVDEDWWRLVDMGQVESDDTAQALAEAVALIQDATGDAEYWRVRVWEGAGVDTTDAPAAEYYP
jgi:hypothetical protein